MLFYIVEPLLLPLLHIVLSACHMQGIMMQVSNFSCAPYDYASWPWHLRKLGIRGNLENLIDFSLALDSLTLGLKMKGLKGLALISLWMMSAVFLLNPEWRKVLSQKGFQLVLLFPLPGACPRRHASLVEEVITDKHGGFD